jgi:hypothetical protein
LVRVRGAFSKGVERVVAVAAVGVVGGGGVGHDGEVCFGSVVAGFVDGDVGVRKAESKKRGKKS